MLFPSVQHLVGDRLDIFWVSMNGLVSSCPNDHHAGFMWFDSARPAMVKNRLLFFFFFSSVVDIYNFISIEADGRLNLRLGGYLGLFSLV